MSLGTAQTGDVKSSMATLKAETEKLGTPKVQGSDLYFGSTKVDKSIVKDVVQKHDMKNNNGAVTIFVTNGDQYVRMLTTVKKKDGSRAVGTPLDANNPAIASSTTGRRTTETRLFSARPMTLDMSRSRMPPVQSSELTSWASRSEVLVPVAKGGGVGLFFLRLSASNRVFCLNVSMSSGRPLTASSFAARATQ